MSTAAWNNEATVQNIFDAIQSEEANGGYPCYGLRVLLVNEESDKLIPLPIAGDVLAVSRVWTDDGPTDNYLPGTCAYSLKCDCEIEDVVEGLAHMASTYGSDNLVLIGGNDVQAGNDYNEVVLQNATVIATFKS